MATKSGAGGLVYSVVAIAIIVLIVSTVAVPVVEDAQSTIVKEENNTSYRYAMADDQTTALIVVDGSIMFNNQPITGNDIFLIWSDDYKIRIEQNVAYVFDYENNLNRVAVSTVALSNKTATTTIGDDTYTSFLDGDIYVYSTTGELGVFGSNNALYASLDSEVNVSRLYFAGFIPNSRISIQGAGTVNELKPTIMAFINNEFIDLSDGATIAVVHSLSEDGKSFYVAPGAEISGTFIYDGTTYNYTFDINRSIIAPLAYNVVDSDTPLGNLIGIIPILLFLVPVMFAVRMIQTRRN